MFIDESIHCISHQSSHASAGPVVVSAEIAFIQDVQLLVVIHLQYPTLFPLLPSHVNFLFTLVFLGIRQGCSCSCRLSRAPKPWRAQTFGGGLNQCIAGRLYSPS